MTASIKDQLGRLVDGIGPGVDATSDMLQLNEIVKRYGDFSAVNGIDLNVPRGEIFGFLGPNGAGKTTTIRMIAGVLEPTEGSVVIGGYDLETHPMQAKARIGYIPDRPFLYEKLSGGEFLRFVSGIWGKDEPTSEDQFWHAPAPISGDNGIGSDHWFRRGQAIPQQPQWSDQGLSLIPRSKQLHG